MLRDPIVIEHLNTILTNELTAINRETKKNQKSECFVVRLMVNDLGSVLFD